MSPSSVSNVLNGKTSKVSDKTRKLVLSLLESENYVSNMGGRMLSKGGSNIIGVIIHNSSRETVNTIVNPFNSEIIGSLENSIRKSGYYMMLYASASVDESVRLAKSWNVKGLIILGSNARDCEQLISSSVAPMVFIDSYYEERDKYYNVGLKDKLGAYTMTRHLIINGHTKIAFLADAAYPVGVDYERYEGVKQALTEAGIPVTSDNYIHVYYEDDLRYTMFLERAHLWLQKYTALFFASDKLAADAINTFEDMKIRVPEDISVAGFDDNIYALMSRPRITTVRQSPTQKAIKAIELLNRCINGEEIENSNILLDVAVEVRGSVKAIK